MSSSACGPDAAPPSMTRRQCKGTTKRGTSCNAKPIKGEDYCRRHLDPAEAKTDRTPKKERDWRVPFLRAFEEHGTVAAACEAAKISRSTVYLERQRNEDFALAWHDIEEATTERMEREAFRRGVEGVEEPVFQRGEQVGAIRKFSDTLLIFMLKSRRPEKYRENLKVEHGGKVTHDHGLDLSKLSASQLDALEQLVEAAQP